MNTLPLFPQDDNPSKLKRCPNCPEDDQWHPATSEFFYRHKKSKDGFAWTCKACDSTRRKTLYYSHIDREHQNKKLYQEVHKEELRERAKLYREANKEEIAEKKKQWQKGDSYKEYQKQWQKEHKEQISTQNSRKYQDNAENRREKQRQYLQTEKGRMVDKAHRHKRKAQKRAIDSSYTSDQLQDQLKRQKHKCYWCHEKLGKGKGAWHADHILPLARGGSNSIDNIVCACPTCNMRRKDKLPHEWAVGGRLI